MNYSLQRRLGSGLLVSLIIAFTLIWLLINFTLKYLIDDYIYTRLTHDTETLLAAVIKAPARFKPNVSTLGAIYQQPFSGHYFEVVISANSVKKQQNNKQKQKQRFRSRSLWDQNLNHVVLENTPQARIHSVGPMQQPLLLLVSQFVKNDLLIHIVVAEDISAIEQDISSFKLTFSLVVMAILLLLIGLQIWGLKRGLTPLKQLQIDLKDLANGEIEQIKTRVPSELIPVVAEINHLHQALAAKLIRHRNALSDLAHALKKPLTVFSQLAKDEQLTHLPEITNILFNQTEATKHLTQRILTRARLAGSAKPGHVFHFDTDLNDLLTTLKMMYRDKNINICVNRPKVLACIFDREDMLELLGNLLDNAYKWAHQAIIITINNNTALDITIEDDGSGIAREDLANIQQRGKRLDEYVTGHGLGIAIVDDIITHYQGELIFSRSERLGGLQVSIKLPLEALTNGFSKN